jgi:large subunit ribosomal protein L4
MKLAIHTLDNDVIDELTLDDSVFAVPVRPDLIARVINWQRAKKRSGNHKTKTISEVSGTGRKPHRQKGTGRSRKGSLRAPQFRGGAVCFGPQPRSHHYNLPKKVRKHTLKIALSVKVAEGNVIILDKAQIDTHKTKALAQKLRVLAPDSALIIDGIELDRNFFLAAHNLPRIDILPYHGINVYDILNHKHLLLTCSAVSSLEARLK